MRMSVPKQQKYEINNVVVLLEYGSSTSRDDLTRYTQKDGGVNGRRKRSRYIRYTYVKLVLKES